MKLNKEQLQQISAFISKRGFTHYDLKLEILDHMACKVEDLMTADSKLSLDDAISITHGQFGVMGLSVFEDAMRDSLRKKYWQYFKDTLLSYLQPKYLPLIAASICMLYVIAWYIRDPQIVFFGSWGLLMASMLANALFKYEKFYRYRNMLTMQMGNITLIGTNVAFQCYNPLNGFFKMDNFSHPAMLYIICAVFITCLGLYYLTMHQVQQLALADCRELEEQYQLTVGN